MSESDKLKMIGPAKETDEVIILKSKLLAFEAVSIALQKQVTQLQAEHQALLNDIRSAHNDLYSPSKCKCKWCYIPTTGG